MFKRFSALLVLLALFIPIIAQAQDTTGTPDEICAAATPAEDPATRTYTEAESVLEPGVDYRAVFCTEAGPIYVDLFETWTPVTVNNFVFLAENGYYNNTTFHRVLEGFMAQGGDPQGTGSGGPGYQFKDEFVGFLTFDRPGLLAMANANDPTRQVFGTNGSQFFITLDTTDWLNYRHTIFGEVLEGQTVVESLKLRDPQQNPDFTGAALDTVVIITDPTTVETSFSQSDEKSTQADVEAVFAGIAEQWADLLSVNEELSGTLTTDEVLSSLPEGIQSDPAAAKLLEDLGHEYRITQRLNNIDCNAQVPFAWISYTVDAYEDTFSADSLLTSGLMNDIATAEGFEMVEPSDTLPYAAFAKDAVNCDGTPGVHARAFLQRGRFVVTAEILFPVDFLPEDVSMDFAVSVLVEQLHLLNIFEPFFGPIYQLETR